MMEEWRGEKEGKEDRSVKEKVERDVGETRPWGCGITPERRPENEINEERCRERR